MSEETLDDLRLCVSNCFNAKVISCSMYGLDPKYKGKLTGGVMSGYNHLSKMMIQDYDLDHNDVDEVVAEIEELVAQYIMENSPKFTDND